MPFLSRPRATLPAGNKNSPGRGASVWMTLLAVALLALVMVPTHAYARTSRASKRVTQPVPPYTVSPPSQTTQATITSSVVQKVPQAFLGLGMATTEMEDFTNAPAFPNYIDLLKPTSATKFVLRIGGTAADSSYWEDDEATVLPQFQVSAANAYEITPPFLSSLASVVSQTGSKVILTANAGAHDPQMAASFVEAAKAALPGGSIKSVAIGNEPDLYHKPTNPVSRNQRWGIGFDKSDYGALFAQYARTLEQDFPKIRLAGPEVASPQPGWESTLLQADAGEVGLVTAHMYPWNACDAQTSAGYPQTGYYLIAADAKAAAARVTSSVKIATDQGDPFRLSELDSATCGGVDGVNDTFATSLWAINQLFDLIDVGVSAVNVHLRADTFNTAIQAVDNTLTPRPLLYGLAAFAQALGDSSRIMQVKGDFPANVKLWAVNTTGGWKLLFVNTNATVQSVDVSLPTTVPASGAAMTTSLLTASSPASQAPTFAGQTISDDGTWQGTAVHATIKRKLAPLSSRSVKTYNVTIPADSAILGTVAAPSS